MLLYSTCYSCYCYNSVLFFSTPTICCCTGNSGYSRKMDFFLYCANLFYRSLPTCRQGRGPLTSPSWAPRDSNGPGYRSRTRPWGYSRSRPSGYRPDRPASRRSWAGCSRSRRQRQSLADFRLKYHHRPYWRDCPYRRRRNRRYCRRCSYSYTSPCGPWARRVVWTSGHTAGRDRRRRCHTRSADAAPAWPGEGRSARSARTRTCWSAGRGRRRWWMRCACCPGPWAPWSGRGRRGSCRGEGTRDQDHRYRPRLYTIGGKRN